jgi:hypothetical protein
VVEVSADKIPTGRIDLMALGTIGREASSDVIGILCILKIYHVASGACRWRAQVDLAGVLNVT